MAVLNAMTSHEENAVAQIETRQASDARMFDVQPGTLYIVGSPIGNLSDASERSKSVLSAVDVVACEDTRVTGLLLAKWGISAKKTSFHEHNTQAKLPYLLQCLREGQTIALVSDAGMPCISDPGTALVAACHASEIPVTVIPGPTAVMTALAGSGMPALPLHFEGFLPARGKERKMRLQAVLQAHQSGSTVVLYEAPHRLEKTLSDLTQMGMNRVDCCVARELTKRYETFFRSTVEAALSHLADYPARGEYVLVLGPKQDAVKEDGNAVDGCPETDEMPLSTALLIRAMLTDGYSVKSIVQSCLRVQSGGQQAGQTAQKINKNTWYAWVSACKNQMIQEEDLSV